MRSVREWSAGSAKPQPDSFARRVLDLVDCIPQGTVVAYGDIAEMLGEGGPRQVAAVMSRWGSEVPWHRVLRADGSCAPVVAARQLALLRAENVPFSGKGLPSERVDMSRARWPGPDR